MRAFLWFGGALLLIVLVGGALLAIPFSTPADRRAVAASAVVALVVQLFAFVVARTAPPEKFLAGWITGVALRFVTVIAYAFVAVKVAGLPAAAALVSLVTLLFISTLVEPRFLTL
jgi:hypothetical protein